MSDDLVLCEKDDSEAVKAAYALQVVQVLSGIEPLTKETQVCYDAAIARLTNYLRPS